MNPHRDEADGDIQHAVVDRAATCITYGYWGEVRIGEATSAVPSVRSLQRTARSPKATRSVPSHCTAPKSPSRTRMNLYLKRPHSSEPRLALAHKERQRPAVVASSSRAAPDGRAMDDAAASKRARDSPERAIGCHRHGHQRLPMRPEGPLCATHRPPMRAQPALKRPVLLTYASDPHEPTQAKSAHVASPDADQAPQRPCSKSPR